MRNMTNKLIMLNEDIHEHNFYSLSDEEVDDMRKDPLKLMTDTLKYLAAPENADADDYEKHGKRALYISKSMGELFLKSFEEWSKYGKQILKNMENAK